MRTRLKVKLVVAGTGVILLLILFLQNTDRVQTNVFFWNFELPRALWMLLMTLAGFVLGWGIAVLQRHRRGR